MRASVRCILCFLVLASLTWGSMRAYADSVVCLHGFFRSYKCMIPLAHALRKEAFEAIYLWDYPSRKKTIEAHAAELVTLLKTIAASSPGEPIHFIAHSLGGLVVRAAVNHPECPPEARQGKAVFLATPNKGAVLAREFQDSLLVQWIFGSQAGQQLLTYTEKEMERFGALPMTMQALVIAGNKQSRFFRNWLKEPNDGKVTVEETRLPSPHIHHTLSVGHGWIMTSRESISIIKWFLLKN